MDKADLINTIICGDCGVEMKKIEDMAVDLIITDPPYGIKVAKNGIVGGSGGFGSKIIGQEKPVREVVHPKDYGKTTWDNEIPPASTFQEMFRVSKNQAIFGGNYFIEHLDNSPCWLVWDKDNSGNFADCELVWTSFPTAVRKIKYRWNGMLQQPGVKKEKRFHPTQKPTGVLEWIIENYSKKGDLILDPFAGSGTTLVACKKLKRDYIGIEREEKYCDIAAKRLASLQPFLDFGG